MTRLRISFADITTGGFESYRGRDEDGYPAATVFDVVYVRTVDGREFWLPRGRQTQPDEDGYTFWTARYDAEEMLAQVEARGSIDPAHWVELDPASPSLQEKLEDEFEREQLERMGR